MKERTQTLLLAIATLAVLAFFTFACNIAIEDEGRQTSNVETVMASGHQIFIYPDFLYRVHSFVFPDGTRCVAIVETGVSCNFSKEK